MKLLHAGPRQRAAMANKVFTCFCVVTGMRPLMSGLAPSMIRACMYSGIQFLTYETVRDLLMANYDTDSESSETKNK